jgi:hypothetical protein
MTTYFTTVGGERGLNRTRENPCRLIDFARLVLRDGASYSDQTGDHEVLLVLFGGRCSVTAGDRTLWTSRMALGIRATIAPSAGTTPRTRSAIRPS